MTDHSIARGLFVFTAGNEMARGNLGLGVAEPVKRERVLPWLPEGTRMQLPLDELYCWGAMAGRDNTAKWQAMRIGDWALCVYDKTYQYAASVVLKVDNDALARHLWGADRNGQTWRLMFFLSRPSRISVPIARLDQYLNAKFLGFTRISPARLQRVVHEFGSVDAFVGRRLLKCEAEQ